MSDETARVTRRGLLMGIGAVAGAGAVLGAMEALDLVPRVRTRPFAAPAVSDFALQGRTNGATVLVLGAGVAGLAAAYELEKAGYRCEVLEARQRPGGRNWTVRGGTTETDVDGTTQTADFAGGIYFNAGPARIPQHHLTLDYCRELGVPVEVFNNANPDAWYFNEERLGAEGSLTGTGIRQRAARSDLYGGISELLAKVVNAGALDEELSYPDREALLAFLRGFGALTTDDHYIGSTRSGTTQRYDLGALLASGVGLHLPFELERDQAMPMFQPVGGMDRLPEALAARLRAPIRYGVEVRELTDRGDRVEVVAVDGAGRGTEASADYCICTLPPMALRRVTSNLPAVTTQALAQAQPVSTGKVGLQYRRRFWETDERIFGGITWTNLDIGTIWYPSHGYLEQRGLLVGAYNFLAEAVAFSSKTPQQQRDRAVQQGMRIHGAAYRDDLEASFAVSWNKVRHSEGGWVAWDQRGAAYRTLLEPDGRVSFAGDHLSEATAWQHGAFESARAAVTALHARVLAEA